MFFPANTPWNIVAAQGVNRVGEYGTLPFRGPAVTNEADHEPTMDEVFWDNRAEEARLVAEVMTTPEAKVELLRVATAYERLARYTRRRREAGRRAPEDHQA